MSKIIVGFVSRLAPDVILPWVASARLSVPDASVTLFADDYPKYAQLQKYGIKVFGRTNLWTDESDPYGVYIDRWNVLRDWLPLVRPDNQVLVVDTRDAVFQRDPFPQMVDGKINVANELLLHREHEWARTRAAYFPMPQAEKLLGSPIICAGVWGARADLAAAFAGDVYHYVRQRRGDFEQHGVNVVMREMYGQNLHEHPYETAWCAHLSLTYGPTRKRDHPGRPVLIPGPVGPVVYPELSGTPFAIVHHVWAKWPELKKLQQKYVDQLRQIEEDNGVSA